MNMTKTYVKGRISKDKRTGYRRVTPHHNGHCIYWGYDGRRKSWKKNKERNEIESIFDEYYSIKNRKYKKITMRWLIQMTE